MKTPKIACRNPVDKWILKVSCFYGCDISHGVLVAFRQLIISESEISVLESVDVLTGDEMHVPLTNQILLLRSE